MEEQLARVAAAGKAALKAAAQAEQAAARALVDNAELDAPSIVEKSLTIAADICVYTNHSRTIEVLGSS